MRIGDDGEGTRKVPMDGTDVAFRRMEDPIVPPDAQANLGTVRSGERGVMRDK